MVIVYITSSLQKPLDVAVIVLEKDNTPFNYPILNSCRLKTVSSTDAYLNLDDCILHNSPMCSLNFVHIVRIVRLTLHFILCNRFYVLLLHSICNSVRMTCLIKRLLIFILSYKTWRRLPSDVSHGYVTVNLPAMIVTGNFKNTSNRLTVYDSC